MNTITLAQKLLTYPTITPKEEGIFAYLASLLPDFKVLHAHKEPVKNIFLYKDFGGENPLHFCFAGHVDVVPPGEGWSVDPFAGVLTGGFLYGRGAQDMKGGIAAFFCALIEFYTEFKEQKIPLILSILLTSDEEGKAKFGTKHMLEVLKEKHLLPHFALVAEPTSMQTLGDSIKVGRRGSISGNIIVQGVPGHVAYPKKCLNPIDLISDKLNLLAGALLDKGDAFFEPSRLVLTSIESHVPAENMTPRSLKIAFNVRHSPATTREDVENFLDRVLSKVPCDIHLRQNSLPFISSKDSLILSCLKQAIIEVLEITPALNTKGGTSDARFFRALGIEVVEFGVCNDRIHSTDERVGVEELEQLQSVFFRLLDLILKKSLER
ncbi:succinyl-diaminopimelate desuccinylase [Helicobacter suis]|uniref:succinyl-diaminopimelate desuccinylase n=1 Tax=Helicobacter suis TaxID=104628 RepID=UPI0013D29877|nr:succinyl-diaminopimelate desuccinylase [Helicobacter suis]